MNDRASGQQIPESEDSREPRQSLLVGAEETTTPAKGDWKLTVEEFSFAGCHYNSSCD